MIYCLEVLKENFAISELVDIYTSLDDFILKLQKQMCEDFPTKSTYLVCIFLVTECQSCRSLNEDPGWPWPGGSVVCNIVPVHRKVVGSIPGQGIYGRQPVDVCLTPMSLSPPSSHSQINTMYPQVRIKIKTKVFFHIYFPSVF